MQPRRFLLLADNPLTLAQLRAEIEDLGEETRCQTALTAEEALFRLSQESVDAVLLLPCPAADCLTQSLIRHPPLAPPFLLGGLDGRLPEISQLPAWFSVLRLPALAAAHLPECTELARQLLTALGMPRTLRAWAFLPEMAALTVVHPPLLTDVTHGLYPLMAHRAADPVRRRTSAAARYRIDMETRRLRCDCALLRAVGRPRTRQAHESGVFVSIAGAIDAQREEDGAEGGVKMRHLRLFSASDMPCIPLQAHTIAVFFIATAMTPAVIASAAQNASHTPVMPKSAAITSAQSTIAATPRRMDVIIAHFAAPTALR